MTYITRRYFKTYAYLRFRNPRLCQFSRSARYACCPRSPEEERSRHSVQIFEIHPKPHLYGPVLNEVSVNRNKTYASIIIRIRLTSISSILALDLPTCITEQ